MAHLLCFASLLVIVLFAILSAIDFKVACLISSHEKHTLLRSYRKDLVRITELAERTNSPAYNHVGSSKANFAAQVNARLELARVAYNKLRSKRDKMVTLNEERLRARIAANQLRSSFQWFNWLEYLLKREAHFQKFLSWGQQSVTVIEANLPYLVNSNPECKTRLEGQLAQSKQALAEYEQFMVKTLDSLKAEVTPTQAERDKFAQDEKSLHDKSSVITDTSKDCKDLNKQLKSKIEAISKGFQKLSDPEKPPKPFYKKTYVLGAAAAGLVLAGYVPNYIVVNQKIAQLFDWFRMQWANATQNTIRIKDQTLPNTETAKLGLYLIGAIMVVALLALLVLVFMFGQHYRSKSGSKKSDKSKTNSSTLNATDSVISGLDDSKVGSQTASKTASKSGSKSSRTGPSASSAQVSTSKTN